ncbi:hypothetical protein E2C01_013570 [Portunus trituberculatus]|uniref:Uncharacterized protein n=1 Tax=Portunus trituberculatus TaxID=210409 RepID=A0A5B7DH02_PORTR|nr:hypothetical protein [Portunus trituberculatus]
MLCKWMEGRWEAGEKESSVVIVCPVCQGQAGTLNGAAPYLLKPYLRHVGSCLSIQLAYLGYTSRLRLETARSFATYTSKYEGRGVTLGAYIYVT